MKLFTVIALLVANLFSAFAVVSSKHESRVLYRKIVALQEKIDATGVERGQLQLEESTLARFGRIERLASEQLQMHMPDHNDVRTVLR